MFGTHTLNERIHVQHQHWDAEKVLPPLCAAAAKFRIGSDDSNFEKNEKTNGMLFKNLD